VHQALCTFLYVNYVDRNFTGLQTSASLDLGEPGTTNRLSKPLFQRESIPYEFEVRLLGTEHTSRTLRSGSAQTYASIMKASKKAAS